MLQETDNRKSKTTFTLTAFFTLIVMINACTKADVEYGSELVGDQYSQIVMSDTFTVNVSTVYLDSFISSATGTGLAGSYKDNAFGQINASSYYQLQPPSFTDAIVSYDSLELILKRNGIFYGDSTQPLQINVYQLSSLINKTNGAGFYNYDSIPHVTSAIGTKTVYVLPNITDTISIRLSDVLGKQLLSLLQNKGAEVSSAEDFVNYFKGLYLSPAQSNAFVTGFKDSIIMRLHYKEISTTLTTAKTADFALNNSLKQFNHISVDRTGTPVASLSLKNELLPSAVTGNAAYMQPATNCMAKISIPYIRNLLSIPSYLRIERAVLIVKPLAGTYSGIYTLPDSLRLTSTDKNNTIGTDITYSTGSVEYGSFTRDYLYEANTQYTYDITTYLTNQVNVTEANDNGLLLRQATDALNTTSFKRAIIGDQQNKTSQIQLQLYYLTVK